MKRIFLHIILVLSLISQVRAQKNLTTTNYTIDTIKLSALISKTVLLPPNTNAIRISSISNNTQDVYFGQYNDFEKVKLEPKNTESEMPQGFRFLDKESTTLVLITERSTRIVIEYFHPDAITIEPNNAKNKNNQCTEPKSVDQSIWRDGLPDPVPGRDSVIVQHCIIHHSAGSNQNTDYVGQVRSIYLLHTQSNGWDDIGYNYLIAPDGTIFKGRDPLGYAQQDNTQGAHFCSKNNGTMGICLLGNYSQRSVSDSTYQSLKNLISWKLYKEDLDPFNAYPHPNSTSPLLNVIAVHQDGCNTECPGDSTLLIIDELKFDVNYQLNECRGISKVHNLPFNQTVNIYPNPFEHTINLDDHFNKYSFLITNLMGQILLQGFVQNSTIPSINLVSGAYLLRLISSDHSQATSAIIMAK